MNEPVIWRGMTRGQLDTAYNNTAAVANSADKIAEWTARSERLRQTANAVLDIPYGPLPRNNIDIFRCDKAAVPLVVFIHGGYWQRNSKEIFSCMAEGPMARGFDVALPGYTLAPDATLTAIVAEIGAALAWLRREGPALGVACGKLIVSGWSAGGHLTAMALQRPEPDAGLAISGIFDVEPCSLNYLNDKLQLRPDEVRALSPIRLPAPQKPLSVAFGQSELPELRRQSADYARYLAEQRPEQAGQTHVLGLAGHDHFSILEELAAPDGRLTAELVRLSA